ncbi:MAG: DUF1592 domain-containing protein [Myxococcales bacterium]|nr:DUF1592 domain-containing protein [Myxococcales bacterium]
MDHMVDLSWGSSRHVLGGLALLAGAALSGCYSGAPARESEGDAASATDSASDSASASASASASGTGGDTDTAGDTDGGAAAALPDTSRFPRLSHRQWENSIRDLFLLGQVTGKSDLFIGDPISGGYDNNSEKLVVSATLWTDYQRAAEEIAEQAVNDPGIMAAIVPAIDGDSTAKASAFIESFGRRVYRRPLTPEEVTRHLEVFQAGVGIGGDDDPFNSGIRIVIQTFLQSPHFLYRVELSDQLDGERIPLSGWELASKLSYMLWDTMPDEPLFAAAEAGELDTLAGIEAEAKRMLADPRAREMIASFHYQTLHVEHYTKINKDAVKFPEFQESMRDMMIAETMTFVEDVVFESGGGLTELLTAPYSFVNKTLAPLYGLDPAAFTDELEATELDPSQRAGVLTHLGFLAANSSNIENDPIHRGVYLNLQILCTGLPPPPDVVPPPPPPMEGETLRERIDRHTGKGTCGEACHGTLINPLGFAFESFDPLGRWQTMDAGKPVDVTGEFYFNLTGATKFDGAVQLADLIAESEEAHRCYVGHLLEYGFARTQQLADRDMIAEIAERSRLDDLPITEIILELTKSDAFRFRAPVEG